MSDPLFCDSNVYVDWPAVGMKQIANLSFMCLYLKLVRPTVTLHCQFCIVVTPVKAIHTVCLL